MKAITLSIISVLWSCYLSAKDQEEAFYNASEADSIAEQVYASYQSYKSALREDCLATATDALKLNLVKDVSHSVPKGCTVDSLVFENGELGRWAYFKSVDLGYIRDVESVITIRTPLAHEAARALVSLLEKEELELTRISDTTFEFIDQQGDFVIDNRFRVPSKSFVSSRYQYRIEVLGDYLIVDIREVVSDYWLNEQRPERKELTKVAQVLQKKNR